jgi:hypothetical protein
LLRAHEKLSKRGMPAAAAAPEAGVKIFNLKA